MEGVKRAENAVDICPHAQAAQSRLLSHGRAVEEAQPTLGSAEARAACPARPAAGATHDGGVARGSSSQRAAL